MSATAGLSSSWTTVRANPQQQAVQFAVRKQQAQAGEAAVAMIGPAVEDSRSPPAPQGQGRKIDIRV